MPKKNPWMIDLNLLSPLQFLKYEDSLEVLRLMRKRSRFSDAIDEVEISVNTARKYIRDSLKLEKGILVPKKSDNLIRSIRIYEDGEEKIIQVKGLKKASTIGRYLSATGQLVELNKKDALDSFEDVTIRDIKGKSHKLETDRNKIFEILERREEPEFFTIYGR